MTIDEIRPFVNKRCKVIVHGAITRPYFGNLMIWDEGAAMIHIDPTAGAPPDDRTGMMHASDITHIELI